MRASIFSYFSNLPTAESRPIQPLPCAGVPPATGLSAGASQQCIAPGLPVNHCPTPPRLVLLKELESDPAKYELSFLSHKFRNKTQEEQPLFLYNLVQEILTLGKNGSHCEPASRMTLAEQRNIVVAQHYRKGKSFVPKTFAGLLTDSLNVCMPVTMGTLLHSRKNTARCNSNMASLRIMSTPTMPAVVGC
jgi:hypothetical protein